MKLKFLHRCLKKYSKIKFRKNPSTGNRVQCGKTEGNGEANSRFSQIFERA